MGKRDRLKESKFVEEIISYYDKFGEKNLPWRDASEPWKVLIAGILLRKTTVKQVVRVYSSFLRSYPNPISLMFAQRGEIENIIRSLGMENLRANQFKQMAEVINKKFNGKVPHLKDDLKKIPGVGEYIASEVALTAFGRSEPLLDRNMIRVLERVFSVRSFKRRPHTDPKLWAFAESLVPTNPMESKKFNFGVLDFARNICKAKNPKHDICELKSICDYYIELNSKCNL